MTSLARHATVPQLRRAVARHAFPAATSTAATTRTRPTTGRRVGGVSAAERRACARPDLSMSYDRDGRFQLRYSAPATVGALVEQALKEAKDALFLTRREAADGPRTRLPRTQPTADAEDDLGRPTYADALEELANRSLASVTSTSRASHYRVQLHLSTDGAWISGGHAIPLRLLGRFISDGVVQPVWETDGRPVSVGRAMRILPHGPAGSSRTATAAAGSPAAPPPASSRSTTCTRGPTAAAPTTTTRSASAPATTTPSTAATTP